MTPLEMAVLLDRLVYKDWEFYIDTDEDVPWVQVRFTAPDHGTGQPARVYGRKWRLSLHMTPSEVVATALKAVLTAEEHEAREQFRYRGRAIFGPHLDVDALAEFAARKENLDLREDADRVDEWTEEVPVGDPRHPTHPNNDPHSGWPVL